MNGSGKLGCHLNIVSDGLLRENKGVDQSVLFRQRAGKSASDDRPSAGTLVLQNDLFKVLGFV